jgi:hypothetical protein
MSTGKQTHFGECEMAALHHETDIFNFCCCASPCDPDKKAPWQKPFQLLETNSKHTWLKILPIYDILQYEMLKVVNSN